MLLKFRSKVGSKRKRRSLKIQDMPSPLRKSLGIQNFNKVLFPYRIYWLAIKNKIECQSTMNCRYSLNSQQRRCSYQVVITFTWFLSRGSSPTTTSFFDILQFLFYFSYSHTSLHHVKIFRFQNDIILITVDFSLKNNEYI